MITYRDKTFCSAKCATRRCARNFTPEVSAAADRWWRGPGAPVSLADFSRDCPQYVPADPEAGDEKGS